MEVLLLLERDGVIAKAGVVYERLHEDAMEMEETFLQVIMIIMIS